MKDRIKKIRKSFDLTQQQFAERIGVKRNTVATYEMGRSIPSDSALSLICREFNVNETWLRTGEGEMFNPSSTSVLDTLAQERNLSDNDYILVEKFLSLSQNKRDAITSYIMECAAQMSMTDSDKPHVPLKHGISEVEIEKKVASYRHELELEKKAGEKSKALPKDA